MSHFELEIVIGTFTPGLSHSLCSLVLTKPWNVCRLFRMLLRGFWLKSTKCSCVTQLLIRLHWIPINVTLRFWLWPLELCMGKHHTILNFCVHISTVRSWGHMITTCWFYARLRTKGKSFCGSQTPELYHSCCESLYDIYLESCSINKILLTFILRGWWLMTSSTNYIYSLVPRSEW